MPTPIHHTFAPHVDRRFLLQTLRLLLQPWRWRTGSDTELLRAALAQQFNGECALFGSGRESLLALLRAMHVHAGQEVIVQGFTCVAIPNAIAAAGALPVYVDIDPQTLNLDCDAVAAAITPRTRMVIAQHTFGIPADMERLRALCDTHGLFLLEDCAHALPDARDTSGIGRLGDGMLLSFGREKAISGVSGGAMICRKPDVAQALRQEEERAVGWSIISVLQLLLYPLLYAKAKLLWHVGLGRVTLKASQLLGLMPQIYTPEEKLGHMSPILHSLPNACAALALGELGRLQAINDRRRTLTALYLQACADHGWGVLRGIRGDLALQKYPLFTERAFAVRAQLKTQNIYLDDGWTGCVVCPSSVRPEDAQYEEGCDPHAESIGTSILSLPTHPTMTEAQARRLVATLAPLLS